MLHTKFQAPEPSGSEEVFFFLDIFICFYGSNTEPLEWGHFGACDLHLKKLVKDH